MSFPICSDGQTKVTALYLNDLTTALCAQWHSFIITYTFARTLYPDEGKWAHIRTEDSTVKESRSYAHSICMGFFFIAASGSKNLLEEYCLQAANDLVFDIQDEAAKGPFFTRAAVLKCVANR